MSFFRPAPGARPPYLAGRESHVDAVASALAVGELPKRLPVLYSGRILTGRTAILTEVAERSRRAGWTTVQVTLRRGDDLAVRLREAVEPAEGRSTIQTIEARCEANPTHGVVVLIDDIDAASDEAFVTFGELTASMAAGARLVVAATCLPSWAHRLLDNAGGQPQATYVNVGTLETVDIVSAVVVPARQHDVTFTRKAVEAIVTRCHGVPALVQMLAHHAAASAIDKTVTEAVVLSTVKAAEKDVVETFFDPFYRTLSTAQQRFLRALRQEGDGASFESVRRRIGDFSRLGTSPVAETRDELLAAGLLYSNDGTRLHFSVAAFSAFVGTVD